MGSTSNEAYNRLSKFHNQRQNAAQYNHNSRKGLPNPDNVQTLSEAEKCRTTVLNDIGRKVRRIQDIFLNDYEIRDLNDKINVLLQEKTTWEARIYQLGGVDYRSISNRVIDYGGREIMGGHGYKYFGRAKELPGVKELLNATERPANIDKASVKRITLFDHVNEGYFGDQTNNELDQADKDKEQDIWNLQFKQFCELQSVKTHLPKEYPLVRAHPISFTQKSVPTAHNQYNDNNHDHDHDHDNTSAKRRKSEKDEFCTVFDVEDLLPPTLYSREEIESKKLAYQKKLLLEQLAV